MTRYGGRYFPSCPLRTPLFTFIVNVHVEWAVVASAHALAVFIEIVIITVGSAVIARIVFVHRVVRHSIHSFRCIQCLCRKICSFHKRSTSLPSLAVDDICTFRKFDSCFLRVIRTPIRDSRPAVHAMALVDYPLFFISVVRSIKISIPYHGSLQAVEALIHFLLFPSLLSGNKISEYPVRHTRTSHNTV